MQKNEVHFLIEIYLFDKGQIYGVISDLSSVVLAEDMAISCDKLI